MKNSVKIPFNFETPWKKFSLSQMTKKGNISTYNASVTQRIKGPHKSPTRKDRKLLRHRHIAFSVLYSAILGIQTLRLSLSAQSFHLSYPSIGLLCSPILNALLHISFKFCSFHTTQITPLPSYYGKESACNAGDQSSIPGSGRSSGEWNGNSLQYSCLDNPMDRKVWWATVHGVAKGQTQLSD